MSESITELSHSLVECRRCPRLVAWREEIASTKRVAFAEETYWGKPVPGFGDPEASVVLVGLAPAAHGANRTGRMFTGDRSGDFLFASLHRTGFANQPRSERFDDGLRLTGAYVTSAVKCAPPKNKPTAAEERACADWLQHELTLLRGIQVVVALGGLAFRRLSQLAPGLGWGAFEAKTGFGHGVEISTGSGPMVIGCYHPSQQNTFTGRLTETMIDAVFMRSREVKGS
jgi:uracil-DNA glycosylase family 4